MSLEKIKDITQTLQVKPDEHKERDGDNKSVVIRGYMASLIALKELLNEQISKAELKELVPVLLVSITCHTGLHYWTSKESRDAAKDVLVTILKLCNCKRVSNLLIGRLNEQLFHHSPYAPLQEESPWQREEEREDASPWQPEEEDVSDRSHDLLFPGGVLKDIIVVLKGNLLQNKWKTDPNAKHTLLWCLRHLNHPHISEYCDSFLPLLLSLTDDYEIYHKHLGLIGLTHLIRNMDSAELLQYGKAEVIYESCKKLLYFNDVDIISSLHPCLLSLLPTLEGPIHRIIHQPRSPGRTDEVLSILLQSMNTETKIHLRKVYIKHMYRYIELNGIYSVRHISSILSIIYNYMEYPDYSGEYTRIYSLRTLCCLMRYTWPRIPNHSESILKSLVRLISDICPDISVIPDDTDTQEQLTLIIDCLVLLMYCCKDSISDIYRQLLNTTDHAGLKSCIEKTLNTCTCT